MIIMVLWVLRRYLTLLLLTISISAAHQEVNEENLRALLTEEEWKSLFGSSATSPEFAIVRPRRLSRRRRRWVEPEHEEMVLEVDAVAGLGRRWELRMRGSDGGLLHPRFVFLRRTGNETEMLGDAYSLKDKDCFYRGGGAALGICDGHTRGIIADQDGRYYVINPLPRRFRRSLEDTPPHVVTRWNLPPALYPHTATDLFEANPHQGRRRRSLPSGVPVYVETAVFIDKDLYRHMSLNFPAPHTERELVRVVLAMINAVQLLYHDPSLGRQVNFVLKRLEILHTDPAALQRPHDIDRFLSSFCLWQRGENPPKDSDPLHWDHALILTGLDLYVVSKNGKVSSQVVGLAPVAGMCTATSSCTVNEGRHFESVYVVAHEIGHNLGMRHDGPLADNECDPGSYIMSPTLGSGKITWSSCSRRYLQMFLETPQSQCLLDHSISGGQLDHSAEGSLPGERFNADQQCMLKYGRGSIHAPEQPLEDVCRDLHCQRDRYTWTSHPALEGTLCGINKWCRSGRCIGRGQSVLQVGTKRIDGAWSNWSPFSECASGCLYSEEGRLHAGSTGIMVSTRRCNDPRPENGGLPCRGSDRRFRTCVAEQCGNVQRTTIHDFADQICIRAREVDSELLGTGLQRISSDSEEACTVWCYKRNGGSKSRGWTFPDGTACQSHRSRYGKSMYCISGRCEEFICDDERYETAATFSLRTELCMRGSSRLQIRSKSRRRDVPQYQRRWSSASGCHFNCLAPGRGLRLVVARDAKCELEETCEPDGSISSVQLCEPDHLSCGRLKTPFEHASTVCSKYRERVRRLSGFGMQISPVAQDPDRPCRVACQDDEVNHRFYLVNGEDGWFPFGTDCSRGMSNKKAYCISGKCLEFGFDDTPLYKAEFTLPLLGRLKRSLFHNTTTTVKTSLDKETLERIVASLNFTESSTTQPAFSNEQFSIDLNNPVHIEMKPKNEVTNNSFSNKIAETVDLYKHFQRRS